MASNLERNEAWFLRELDLAVANLSVGSSTITTDIRKGRRRQTKQRSANTDVEVVWRQGERDWERNLLDENSCTGTEYNIELYRYRERSHQDSLSTVVNAILEHFEGTGYLVEITEDVTEGFDYDQEQENYDKHNLSLVISPSALL